MGNLRWIWLLFRQMVVSLISKISSFLRLASGVSFHFPLLILNFHVVHVTPLDVRPFPKPASSLRPILKVNLYFCSLVVSILSHTQTYCYNVDSWTNLYRTFLDMTSHPWINFSLSKSDTWASLDRWSRLSSHLQGRQTSELSRIKWQQGAYSLLSESWCAW